MVSLGRSQNSRTKPAATCTTASPRPNAKAGSAKSRASRSASPAPRTRSPRSTPPGNARTRPSTSACPRSPTSLAAPSRPHRKDLVTTANPHRLSDALRACAPRHPSPRGRDQPAHRLRQMAPPRRLHHLLHPAWHQHRHPRWPPSTGKPPSPPCAGELPSSSGERRIVLLAASIAGGVPVSLYDTLPGSDRRNASLAVKAIAHATGLPCPSVNVP
jgi:hypothetical protein